MEALVDHLLDRDVASMSLDEHLEMLAGIREARALIDAVEQRVLVAASRAGDEQWRRREWSREEIAAAMQVSPGSVAVRMSMAKALTGRFERTFERLVEGSITLAHARAMVDAAGHLDPDASIAVENRVLDNAKTQTVPEFRQSVRRAVIAIDPATAEERARTARKGRHVRFWDEDDGMGTMAVYASAADLAGVRSVLDSTAHALSGDPGTGQSRTLDERRCDIVVDLMLGRRPASVTAPPAPDATTPTDATTPSDGVWSDASDGGVRSGSEGVGEPGRSDEDDAVIRPGLRPDVRVTVALATLLHLDDQPGELDGYGPITAETARRIAHDPTGTWRRLLTDSAGRLVRLSSTRYRPPKALRDHIQAQFDTCSFVGCRTPSARSEIDHIVPWPEGETSVANTHPACPRHHHLRHETGWTVTRHSDNTVTWTSATGREYTTEPTTWPVDVTRDPDRLYEGTAAPPGSVVPLPDDPPF